MTDFTSPTEQLFLGAVLAFVGKFVWDRWLSKGSRVTSDKCTDNQKICREEVLKEFQKHKFDVGKIWNNQARLNIRRTGNMAILNGKIHRTNILLEALIGIQLEFCKVNPALNFEKLMRLLVKQGVQIKEDKDEDENGVIGEGE